MSAPTAETSASTATPSVPLLLTSASPTPAVHLINHTDKAFADLNAVIQGRITTREYADVVRFTIAECYISTLTPEGPSFASRGRPVPMVVSMNETLDSLTKSVQEMYDLESNPNLSAFWPLPFSHVTEDTGVGLTRENTRLTLIMLEQTAGGSHRIKGIFPG
ncbi:MAG: hypothetical protein Q9161_001187 [Pseudevernia consocians]